MNQRVEATRKFRDSFRTKRGLRGKILKRSWACDYLYVERDGIRKAEWYHQSFWREAAR